MKVGQFPQLDVSGNQDVERMLGTHKLLLRRGLVSESQGYGIGAFAYYRRIVEEVIDGLLVDIEQLISEDERPAFSVALAQTRATRITSEKINLVKDLLPPLLRPDDMNPLALLHSTLSEGLHTASDERCLELAAETRETLVFLATQVTSTAKAKKLFTDKMRALLDKKSKPST